MKMKTNKTFAYGFLTVIIVLGILFPSACKNEPETITVEKDVTVSYPNTTIGAATINLTPTFSPDDGWNEHFNASDITCTMTDTLNHNWNSGTGFTVSINDGPYADSNTYIFTQTFKMNGVEVGKYIIRIRVLFGSFAAFRNAEDSTITTLPPIQLHLEKTVTK
jgi:hypothetical protein